MSVIVTMRFTADPGKLEQAAEANQDTIQAIGERAKEFGVIAHRFYGADGQVMVLDEWPDADSFQRFFQDQRPQIEPLMQELGAGEPEITFWRKLETHDDVGWGA
jgi:quinol monooxygenase YgiN